MNHHPHRKEQAERKPHHIGIALVVLLGFAVSLLVFFYRRGDTSEWPRVAAKIVAHRVRPADSQPAINSKWRPGVRFVAEYEALYRVGEQDHTVWTAPVCSDYNRQFLESQAMRLLPSVHVVVRYNPADPTEAFADTDVMNAIC